MKATRRKSIAEAFFAILWTEYGIETSDIVSMDGYYLFNFGKDSVWHFRLKGARRWKWGIWINSEKQGSKKYRVEVFAQHNDYIDKFKPSYSVISGEFIVNLAHQEWKEEMRVSLFKGDECKDLIYWMRKVSREPELAKYEQYSYSQKKERRFISISKFLLRDFWFYRIENPFFESSFLPKIGWLMAKVRFPKVRVKFIDNEELFFPRYEIRLYYDRFDDDDDIKKVYGSKILKVIGTMLDRSHTRIGHHLNEADERGFYYKEIK